MSFYFRKSIRVGPLRFNLSKSGVGVSTGIKGFRVGFGPRGNYVHAGAAGVYYRSTLTPKQIKRKQSPTPEIVNTESSVEMKEIDSDVKLLFQNSTADELVQEINEKMKKWSTWKPIGIASVISLFYTHPIVFGVGILATIAAYLWDETRRSVVLFYDFDENKEAEYKQIIEECDKAFGVNKIWHIASQGKVDDWKKNAGADALVKRAGTSASLNPPKFIKANIPIPTIKVGSQTLCLLPEKALLISSDGVGSISYSELNIEIANTSFIETQGVPSDAEVIDYSWRYVNKKGGPDKRFKDNTQIPVCRYETIVLRSDSGLNEQLMLSKCGQFNGLRTAIKNVKIAA